MGATGEMPLPWRDKEVLRARLATSFRLPLLADMQIHDRVRAHSPSALGLLALAIAAATAPAQGLVRDIRTTSPSHNGSSAPTDFRDAGSRAFFVAAAADTGTEPYVTDGTPAGTHLVADFALGEAGSAPAVLAAHQGLALLSIRRPGASREFVLSDGTAAGSQNLGTLGLPDGTYTGTRLPNGNFVLERVAEFGVTGQAYATDLTAPGTVQIPGMTGFTLALTSSAGVSYVWGNQGNGNFDLWRSDGTVAGSQLLATNVFRQGPDAARFRGPTEWNGRIWFLRAGNTSIELWSTDGTPNGATFHATIPGLGFPYTMSPLAVVGNRLLFVNNAALWSSDGTQAGTQAVPNMPCDTLAQPVVFQGRLYFSAAGAGTGFELWSSDGTGAGTQLVADLVPGPASSNVRSLTATPQGLWLHTVVGNGELRLVTSPQNMTLVGPASGGITTLGVPYATFGGGILAGFADATTGVEPYFATPTQAPSMLADLQRIAPGIDTTMGVRVRDRVFFGADDGTTGRELWVSDGSAAGTYGIDFTAGTAGTLGFAQQDSLVAFRDGVAMIAQVSTVPPRRALLVSDGTHGGTRIVTPPMQVLAGLSVSPTDQVLYFHDGARIYRSDGTVAGTSQLPVALPFGTPEWFYPLSQRLVFGSSFDSLYGTDGLQLPTAVSQGVVRSVLGPLGERLLFRDDAGLRSTDGTVAGTTTIAPSVNWIGEFTSDDTAFYFLTTTGLWRTDGTTTGTTQIAAAPANLQIQKLIANAGGLFALAVEPTTGRELYRFDAANAQFVLVADIAPGAAWGVGTVEQVGAGPTLFLTANDGLSGNEPWISDGTTAGTRRLADVFPGAASSGPDWLCVAGPLAYFVANDDVHGRELRAVSLAAIGAASVQTIAAGCAGQNGQPALGTTVAPRLGAAAFGYQLSEAPASALTALLLGFQLGQNAVAGCAVAPIGTGTSMIGLSTVGGAAFFALPIPAAPALLGLQLTSQGFALDATTSRGFTGSNGLFVVVGS